MAIEKGSAFLLKIGDGTEPPAFATMAGLRTTQLSINGETVVVTSKDSGGWRELLSGAGCGMSASPAQGYSPDRRRRPGCAAMRWRAQSRAIG